MGALIRWLREVFIERPIYVRDSEEWETHYMWVKGYLVRIDKASRYR